MTVEPVIGNPEEMAEAIAKALTHIEDRRKMYDRTGYAFYASTYSRETILEDRLEEAEQTLALIEEALENYQED